MRAQPRPPFGLTARLETISIGGSNDVSADAFFILDHECGLGRQNAIRRSVDVADEFWIAIEMRGIRAGIAGPQTDVVKFVEIVHAIRPDINHVRCWRAHRSGPTLARCSTYACWLSPVCSSFLSRRVRSRPIVPTASSRNVPTARKWSRSLPADLSMGSPASEPGRFDSEGPQHHVANQSLCARQI